MHEELMIICDSWSETNLYKNRKRKTKENIKKIIKDEKITSISYSGGKDSLVLVHLITEFFPTINTWHWDYGILMPREFEKEVINNLKKIAPKINLIIDKRQSEDPSSDIGYKEFYEAIKKNIKKLKIKLNIVGLRKEESTARSSRLQKGQFEKFCNSTSYFPLSEWLWQDVWTYIYENNISYPKIYDLYGPLYGWDKVRFVTFFDPEFNFLGCDNIDKFFLYEKRNIYAW